MTQEMFYRLLKRWPTMHFTQMQVQGENGSWSVYAMDPRASAGGRIFITRHDTLHTAELATSVCQRWLDYRDNPVLIAAQGAAANQGQPMDAERWHP